MTHLNVHKVAMALTKKDKKIIELEAEIALRGERLEYLFMRYAYQRKPMPYISGWFKDGKYIEGEG